MVIAGIYKLPFSIIIMYYPIYSIFPLQLASTSDCCSSLLGMGVGVIQTFIPERSGPLVVLSELGCCSLPLTLITGYGKTNILSDLLLFQIYSSLSPWWSSSAISL